MSQNHIPEQRTMTPEAARSIGMPYRDPQPHRIIVAPAGQMVQIAIFASGSDKPVATVLANEDQSMALVQRLLRAMSDIKGCEADDDD